MTRTPAPSVREPGRSGPPAARAALALLPAAVLTIACQVPAPPEPAAAFDNRPAASALPGQAEIDRGKYLTTVLACGQCHTPRMMGPRGPEPDLTRYMSGHPEDLPMPPAPTLGAPWLFAGAVTNTAFSGPWGVSFATNLTPDDATGIGSWTSEMFVSAMRSGKHLGVGRPIMPPMPWQAYAQMTDEDLRAVFAYLKSLPARRNRVPEGKPAAPPVS